MSTLTFVGFWILLLLGILAIGILSCVVYELREELRQLKVQIPALAPGCSCARGATLQVSAALRRIADEIERGGYSS